LRKKLKGGKEAKIKQTKTITHSNCTTQQKNKEAGSSIKTRKVRNNKIFRVKPNNKREPRQRETPD
jgi:hypothetical protein